MILVDTSVWVDHMRQGNEKLADLLRNDQVVTHSMVIGELACGRMSNRAEILARMSDLPSATVASHEEVMGMIERHQLAGRGIGFIDAHLLASALLSAPTGLWTLDGKLNAVAEGLLPG